MGGIYQFGIFSWILLVTSTLSVGFFFYLLRYRKASPAAGYLALLCLAGGIWAFANYFETAALTRELKLFWSQASYLGSLPCPLFYFLFSLAFTGREKHLSIRNIAFLAALPFLAFVLALTNEAHNLIWTGITFQPGSSFAVYGHGPMYWAIVVGYSYVLMMGGFLIMGLHIPRLPRFYRMQSLLVIGGIFLPFFANIIYVFGPNPLPGLDWTPLGFLLTVVILVLSVMRYRLFDVVPIARHSLVETMSDGILVLDEKFVILDINRSMRTILGSREEECIGRKAREILSFWPEILPLLDETELTGREIPLHLGKDSLHFDVNITPLFMKRARLHARLFTLRDISRRIRLEEEREKLRKNLKEASTQVQNLERLLPICASCKKIRDIEGKWHEVSSYMTRHTSIEFTHGLCPDCLGKYYDPGKK